MQKILVGLWVKKFTISILSSLKPNLPTTFFATCQPNYVPLLFRIDTGKH